MNKEEVYDEKIAPLMTQIIAICKEHRINAFATFSIPTEENPDLGCTTSLPIDHTDELGFGRMESLRRVQQDGWIPQKPWAAFTITTTKAP